MNLDTVIGEVTERDGSHMVLNLLGESSSQSIESAYRHPNREVMTFDVASVDVLRIGCSGNRVTLTSKAHSGAVALLSIVGNTVDLHQHRVVHVAAKRPINRLDVKLQSIAGKLDAIRQSSSKIFNKVPRSFRGTLPDVPARHQLAVCVNCGPEPCIARTGVVLSDVRGDVLLFGIHERPALINLHPFAFQVAEHPVLVIGTERAKFNDQPKDGLFRHARYANGGTDRAAFNQATNDLGALVGSEVVYTFYYA